MNEPLIAETQPIPVDCEAGKTYFWCACGRSRSQPFCDGSHRGSEFTPIKFEAERAQRIYFCACKRSALKPRCDGTHKRLNSADVTR
jgi:CDGSH-type Zn-finger protein